MTVYLPDVNVLLALSDPRHVHNVAVHDWFGDIEERDWATCPLTENGLLRILSHPSYPNRPGDVSVVLALLEGMCSRRGHQFWADEISARDLLRTDQLIAHAQITDLYLLGLAVHYGGKLATLDRRLTAAAISGGAGALELIAP